MSGRGGGDENEIDFFCRDPGLLHGRERGSCRHVAGAFVFRSDPAFLDSSARGDPLVRRIDHA